MYVGITKKNLFFYVRMYVCRYFVRFKVQEEVQGQLN